MQALKVTGMSCGGCVGSVRRIIARQTGLDDEAIEVDLETGRARFPEPKTDLEALLEKLERAGFPSTPLSD